MPSKTIKERYRFVDEKGEARTLRLAPKAGPASAVRILYLHGGAYVYDLMAIHWPVLTGLVDRTGAEIVIPLYPLAPESHVTDGLAVTEAAYLRLVDAVGSKNIAIAGDSAGGGLALSLAQRLRDAGLPLPSALVLFFPWLDVTLSGADQPSLQSVDPVLSSDRLREAGIMWAGKVDPAAPSVSPLFADQQGLPPTLLLAGTHDVLVSDSRRLADRNPDVQLSEYPKMFHGWICAPIPEAQRALDEAAAFIDGRLRR